MTACRPDGLPAPGVDALRAWIDPCAWWWSRLAAAIATTRPANFITRGRATGPFATRIA